MVKGQSQEPANQVGVFCVLVQLNGKLYFLKKLWTSFAPQVVEAYITHFNLKTTQ